jgi:hypothetical protein
MSLVDQAIDEADAREVRRPQLQALARGQRHRAALLWWPLPPGR